MSALSLTAAASASLPSFAVVAATISGEKIEQPARADSTAFIKRAFEMRRLAIEHGDQPYGAIVVRDEKIIGQSWSRVIIDADPTAHAEISAIRHGALKLRNSSLAGGILYSSSRPCPMCEAAAYWAGIERMIYGKSGLNAGSPRLCT